MTFGVEKKQKKTNYQWLILNSYTALWVFFYGVGYLQLEFSEIQSRVCLSIFYQAEFFYVCCTQKQMPLDLSWLKIGKLTTFQDWYTGVLLIKKFAYVKSSQIFWFNSNTYYLTTLEKIVLYNSSVGVIIRSGFWSFCYFSCEVKMCVLNNKKS